MRVDSVMISALQASHGYGGDPQSEFHDQGDGEKPAPSPRYDTQSPRDKNRERSKQMKPFPACPPLRFRAPSPLHPLSPSILLVPLKQYFVLKRFDRLSQIKRQSQKRKAPRAAQTKRNARAVRGKSKRKQ